MISTTWSCILSRQYVKCHVAMYNRPDAPSASWNIDWLKKWVEGWKLHPTRLHGLKGKAYNGTNTWKNTFALNNLHVDKWVAHRRSSQTNNSWAYILGLRPKLEWAHVHGDHPSFCLCPGAKWHKMSVYFTAFPFVAKFLLGSGSVLAFRP